MRFPCQQAAQSVEIWQHGGWEAEFVLRLERKRGMRFEGLREEEESNSANSRLENVYVQQAD